jgi:hypothetical protein
MELSALVQNIAFWTNSLSNLHHEIKVWLVIKRLIALKNKNFYFLSTGQTDFNRLI